MRLLNHSVTSVRRAAASVGAACAAALFALAATLVSPASPASAQVPAFPAVPPPPKSLPTEKQSPRSPFPRGAADNQNRSRGGSDMYWGVADGNVPWFVSPLARVQNIDANTLGLGSTLPLTELDGWQYPRVSQDGAFFTEAAVRQAYATAAGVIASAAAWTPQTETGAADASTDVRSPDAPTTPKVYYRGVATPRTAQAPRDYPAANKFVWSLQDAASGAAIPGAPFQVTRYRIYVRIPTPADNTAAEARVSDARYTVYYYTLREGGDRANPADYEPREQTFIASQIGGGIQVLRHSDGTDAFFPFLSSATNFAALPEHASANGNGTPRLGAATATLRQGVALDNTTEDDVTGGAAFFVIADALQLEPGLDRLVATPTVTTPTGGTFTQQFRAARAPADTGGAFGALVPGKQDQPRSFLPSLRGGDTNPLGIQTNPLFSTPPNEADLDVYRDPANAPTVSPDPTVNRFPFANDPRDPLYDPNNATYNPNGFANPTFPLETWNPSVLFEGPEMLIDPRVQYDPAFAGSGNRLGDLLNAALLGLPGGLGTHPTGVQVGPGIPDRISILATDPSTIVNGDPRTATSTIAGAAIYRTARASDANNFQRYGRTRERTAATGDPTFGGLAANVYAKLFSQMQVVVGRTEYTVDPERNRAPSERTGTRTLQLGAIYSYDWLTGAPIWRFPDRTYLPAGTRNPNGTAVTDFVRGDNGAIIATGTTVLAGLRNQSRGTDAVTGRIVFDVPGIVYADRNGDGLIDDDEVFLGNDGLVTAANVSTFAGVPVERDDLPGGVFASVTLAPRVMVRGASPVPTYAEVTGTNGVPYRVVNNVAVSTPGRYATRPETGDTLGETIRAVPVGVAFVAAGNGVLYAIDAYGNNDTRYIENTLTTYRMGRYQPGTTNVLWTFSADQHGQRTDEATAFVFNTRRSREIPATGSFGASAPVLAYAQNERDLLERDPDPMNPADAGKINRRDAELRLFVGNLNGVLYALDARALNTGPTTSLDLISFPYRKGIQVGDQYTGGFNGWDRFRADVKWWFRARGGINWAPAVSQTRQDSGQGTATPGAAAKGVYVASNEGRIYCLDWDGPVARRTATGIGRHTNYLNFDGTGEAARALNDDFFFNNTQPAFTVVANTTDGNVRPRWAFPQAYRDIGVDAVPRRADLNQTDTAQDNAPYSGDAAGTRIATPAALGSITTPPVLMEFPVRRLNASGSPGAVEIAQYVVFSADDPAPRGGLPTQSRLYLLDQVGDRVNLMTNPRRQQLGGATTAVAISQPRDRFSPKTLLSVPGDPTLPTGLTWTFRYQYDYHRADNTQQGLAEVTRRNSPNATFDAATITDDAARRVSDNLAGRLSDNWPNPGTGSGGTGAGRADRFTGAPGRRVTPTIFVGGAGEVYALDIDPETGLFMRWRPTLDAMRRLVPLAPETFTNDPNPTAFGVVTYPGLSPEAVQDRIFPADRVFTGTLAGLANQRVLARRVGLLGEPTLVTALTVSGGPLQNRNNLNPQILSGEQPDPLPPPTAPDVYTPPVPAVSPFVPTVPQTVVKRAGANAVDPLLIPTNDAPILRPWDLVATDPTGFDPAALVNALIPGGHVSNLVNQEINDPLTTKTGVLNSDLFRGGNTVGGTVFDTTLPISAESAYQFPILIASTNGGLIQGLSTNIEGEDYVNNGVVLNGRGPDDRAPGLNSQNNGWAFAAPGNRLRYNPLTYHVLLFTQVGPGGPAGVAVASPTYFPALDPAGPTFNPATQPQGTAYNAGEPNQAIDPTPGGDAADTSVTNPTAHPKPNFRPRPLSFGVVGNPAAMPPVPDSLPDIHTGQSGFPLDPNGLFFDKRFAGLGYSSPLAPNNLNNGAQDPNGDYHVRMVRVPGYSGIGEALDPTVGNKILPVDQNQYAEGVRYNANGAAGEDLYVAGTVLQRGNLRVGGDGLLTDDINPIGQNITWFYAGSQHGALYAFTPSIYGQSSGLVGGISAGGGSNEETDPFGGQTTQRVDIITPEQYAILRNTPQNPRDSDNLLAGSVVANGGKNFYEWGESIYLIAYDILVGAETPSVGRFSRVRSNNTVRVDAEATRISFTITDRRRGGTQVARVEGIRLQRAGGGIFTYPYSGPAGYATNVQAGYAVYELKVAPTRSQPFTPGAALEVSLNVQPGPQTRNGRQTQTLSPEPGAGGTIAQATSNIGARLSIANPIAVQGFLSNTAATGGVILPVGVPGTNPANLEYTNAIGPFRSEARQTSGLKDRVLLSPTASGAGDDPDRANRLYHQALTNGNTLQRVDLRPFADPDRVVPNQQYGNPIREQGSGSDEPVFYFPVAASAGYISHGTNGSTSPGGDRQYLRILNRSLLDRLGNVRALPEDQPGDLLFRAWPGAVMNAPAAATDNPRTNPAAMHPLGVIAPLPWDRLPTEARPYTPAADTNYSEDYPDIPARSNKALTINAAGSDMTGRGTTLTSTINTTSAGSGATAIAVPQENSTIFALHNSGVLANPLASFAQFGQFATTAQVRVPRYQPANLVAAHTLTSTYQALAPEDINGTGLSPELPAVAGPLQLPRGQANRALRQYGADGSAPGTGSPLGLSPFGYTSRVVVFVDIDGTNRLNNSATNQAAGPGRPPGSAISTATLGAKAFREFEVWTGVPVDQGLKIGEQTLDLGSVPHGFAVQNGQLGYEPGSATPQGYGFLPAPLFNFDVFAGTGAGYRGPYDDFFKSFTVQGTGNVNLYNLRGSQRTENYTAAGAVPGSGFPFYYLALRSDLVDPRFGILAVGTDPRLSGVAGVIGANVSPQVVTSLDRQYDSIWDAYLQGPNFLDPATGQHALLTPDATGVAPYARYYRQLGGLHTLHKPRVGSTAPSVLSIPDLPGARQVRTLEVSGTTGAVVPDRLNDLIPNRVERPTVAAAVPLGTPAGAYQSSNSPFAIFEDHDTRTSYNPTPVVTGGASVLQPTIAAAGPLYDGQNITHPGNPALGSSGVQPGSVDEEILRQNNLPPFTGPRPVRVRNGDPTQGIWRVRSFVPDPAAPGGVRAEYLPATSPSLTLKVNVTESALTGQAPDRALATATDPVSVVTGVLPGIDAVPQYTLDTTNTGATVNRPVSALSPAAWRDARGNIHVYYARNVIATPGAPYRLFASSLRWDGALGTFTSQLPGAPLSAAESLAVTQTERGAPSPTASTAAQVGRWFTRQALVPLAGGIAGTASTVSPFVLTHYAGGPAPTGAASPAQRTNVDAATLFFTTSVPTNGGQAYSQIFWLSLNPTDGSAGTAQPYLDSPDPAIQRFAPRAVFSDAVGRVYLFYYGGTPGRYSIYYSVRTGENGAPTGAPPAADVRTRELQAAIPSALVSATDPSPILRRLAYDPLTGAADTPTDVIDLYYTAVSRASTNPEVYMTRYVYGRNAAGTPVPNRLAPVPLPRVLREKLANTGGGTAFRGQHIAWFGAVDNAALRPRLPVIYIQRSGVAGLTTIGDVANWRFDTATGVLFQTFGAANTLTYVYVDTSAGTVRFRGPLSPRLNENVFADYEPQTYQISRGGGANGTPMAFADERYLPATVDATPGVTVSASDTILRRPAGMTTGRQWLMWQRGASGARPATIVYRARRVGVDLRNSGFLSGSGLIATETIALGARNATTLNQAPQVTVTVDGVARPYDVDAANGRIYIEPQYEGRTVTVAYGAAIPGNPTPRTGSATAIATMLDELTTGAAADPGIEAPILNRVNEGQPYAFLDTFDPFPLLSRPAGDPAAGVNRYNVADPSLTPGRVWLLWTSPQARRGTVTTTERDAAGRPLPNAFNLFWETLAPNFEGNSLAPRIP